MVVAVSSCPVVGRHHHDLLANVCDKTLSRPTVPQDVDDAEYLSLLVEEAKCGSADAWEALYRRSYHRLFAYACRRLPSAECARDAVAETMARAVVSLERFADRGNGFDAWLSGIHRHVVVDTYRKVRREWPVDGHDLAAGADTVPQGGDVGERLTALEDAQALRRAFASLSPADQEVLELRVVAELGVEEVARKLGKRPGAIRMAQSRALARLRESLEETGSAYRASA